MDRVLKNVSTVRAMIRAALASSEAANLMHRLDCVMLIAAGRSVDEVADWLGVGRRSVQRWVRAAYTRGTDGLVEHHQGGRPATLTREQAQAICSDLRGSPLTCGYKEVRWTGKRLALHLHRRLGVSISVRTCQRMIARTKSGPAVPG